jgi:hypothetical protein
MQVLDWRRTRFRMALWASARTLPWRVRRLPLNDVLEIARPSDRKRYAGLPANYIARAVDRTTRHTWLMRDRKCLRRGLLGYRFLSEAGFWPELHFSVDPHPRAQTQLIAHCWVCIDGVPIINQDLPGSTTVLVYSDPGFASVGA